MKQKLLKRIVLIILVVLVVVAAAFYISKSIFYKDHFYKGTTINGIDVSDHTLEEVKTIIQSGTVGYALTIVARGDVTETIDGDAIDLAPVWDGSIDAILASQNGFSWLQKSMQPDAYTSETMIGFDSDKLRKVFDDISFVKKENQVAPVDASMTDYVEGVGYQLIPSEAGTTFDTEVLYVAVEEAIDRLDETLSVEELACYMEPAVKDDDAELNRRLGILQEYCQAKITYEVGEDVFDLDSDTYHEWFIIAEDGSVTIDEELAKEYVKSLGHKYNTCYSYRDFETSYGQTVKITESDYGWKVDYATETAQVIDEINNHVVTTRDLNYLMVANTHNKPDYGNSYVEINLTAQHLFMYKDGELIVETDFVSGNVSANNGTPCGIYGLTYKTKDATLRGATYESHVDYWMPFNGNVGMHDASWRSKFGAAIYLRSGSHGCVNLPRSAAEEIYEAISKDYPVIVYELAGTESDKGKAQIAAYSVIDLITAIGEVTIDSEEAITVARNAYDALSETGKSYVKNASALTDAEKAYKELVKKESSDKKDKKDKTDKKEKKDKKEETSKPDNESNEGVEES